MSVGGDLRLVMRASQGSIEALGRLVRVHSGLVHRAVLCALGGEVAREAGQEVWIRVWSNIESLKGESAFSTWRYRIAVDTCLSLRQRQSRREAREVGGEAPYLSEPTGGDTDPGAVVLRSERREEMRAALRYVRAEYWDTLVLRHIEGLSYTEIAETLDVPDGTVKGWVSRGRDARGAGPRAFPGQHGTRGRSVRGEQKASLGLPRAHRVLRHWRVRGRAGASGVRVIGREGRVDAWR